jgi:hypothetical protein
LGLIIDTVKQYRSKAMDMRFYWIKDRLAQGQYQGSAQELAGELPGKAEVSRVVAITDKVGLPEPAHGGGLVGYAKVAVASCGIVLHDAEQNPDHAGQDLEEVDRLAPSEMQRDLPVPSLTRFERVAAETVLTSVGPKDVVRLSSCQKVQVDAGVGDNKEVLPEYQVLCLLG